MYVCILLVVFVLLTNFNNENHFYSIHKTGFHSIPLSAITIKHACAFDNKIMRRKMGAAFWNKVCRGRRSQS